MSRIAVAIVVPSWELEGTQVSVDRLLHGPRTASAEVHYITLDRHAVQVARRIRECSPSIIFIGHTALVLPALSHLRMVPTPLIVRRSSLIAQIVDRIDGETEWQDAYHLDMPKDVATLAQLIIDPQFLGAAVRRDPNALRQALPNSVTPLAGFENWVRGAGTLSPDLPLKDFMYMDEAGVDLLFQQSGKHHLEEVLRRTTRATSGAVSAKIGFGKLFELFGLGQGDLSGSLDHNHASTEEFTEKLPTVGKLTIVIDALSEADALIELGAAGLMKQTITAEAIYVNFTGWFDTRDIVRACTAADPMKEFASFPSTEGAITLGASLSKFHMGLHHVTKILGFGESRLRVFAKATGVGDHFYLKPFSFWLTHVREATK